eukprot:TRINITY_DN1433_c1_g1_i1.p1 TRINITY_DN1433_c1_g1~~TRINITY_DN1433_c1_g1_i1.p1  ORF type:complete len:278 (-),score=3.90 TRINITY_DN1433_c1_g1_i1:422-1255(-)
MAFGLRVAALSLGLLALCSLVVAAPTAYDGSWSQYFKFADWCKGQYYCKQNSDGSVAISAHWNKVGSFSSYSYYYDGVFSWKMKLPSGYSGGVIPCMYLISGGGYKDIHDEIDFEFLGGNTPRDMIIHTNLISGGQNKLEQFRFPFDPSADWHTYKIVYSPRFVAWFIDDTPIRVTWKQANRPFPSMAMQMRSSVWDASSWSPLRANWNLGAVTAQFRDFAMWQVCAANRDGSKPACAWDRNPRTAPWMQNIPGWQVSKMAAFRKSYTKAVYDWQKT